MSKNEKTSKKVSGKAGHLLARINAAHYAIGQMQGQLLVISNILSEAGSVAASALTQAPDKKKR